MLTLAQQRTLRFIRQFIAQHGYAPTVAEVAVGIGIKSKGVAHRYIQALVSANKLRLVAGRHRNIKLIAEDDAGEGNGALIPLLGKIAAGEPIEAIVNQEFLDVQALFAGQHRYALRVKGDSMIDEGIFDDDMVICERCDTASNGEIVVALIDNEAATLKKLQKNKDNTVTLIPANAALSPKVFAADRVRIQGRFVGLLRLH